MLRRENFRGWHSNGEICDCSLPQKFSHNSNTFIKWYASLSYHPRVFQIVGYEIPALVIANGWDEKGRSSESRHTFGYISGHTSKCMHQTAWISALILIKTCKKLMHSTNLILFIILTMTFGLCILAVRSRMDPPMITGCRLSGGGMPSFKPHPVVIWLLPPPPLAR